MKSRKVIGIFLIYILYFYLSKTLIIYLLNKGYLLDSSLDFFFKAIDVILHSILILIFYFSFKSIIQNQIKFKVSGFLFFIPIIVIAFRITEDPIFNFKYIFEGVQLRNIVNYEIDDFSNLIYGFITMVLLAPLLEELVFRKIMLEELGKTFTSILFSSALFSLIHIFNGIEVTVLLSAFLFGIILGFVYLKYGVFYSFLIHLAYNLLFFIIRYYYYDSYVEILSKLDFNWIYWLIVLGSLVILVGIVKWLYTSVFR